MRLIRAEVERIAGFGPERTVVYVGGGEREGDPPLTGKVKKKSSNTPMKRRIIYNHNYVGTEHLLLALLRQTDGVAAQVLENLNVNLKEIRKEVLKELETSPIYSYLPWEATPQPILRTSKSNAFQQIGRRKQQLATEAKCQLFAPMVTPQTEICREGKDGSRHWTERRGGTP